MDTEQELGGSAFGLVIGEKGGPDEPCLSNRGKCDSLQFNKRAREDLK